MALKVQDIQELMLTNNTYGNILGQMNNVLKSLIENDNSMLFDNTLSPKLWECRWLNDSSIEGYPKGYAVWLNTDTPNDILKAKRDEISNYIINNDILSREYQKVNQKDPTAVNNFFLDAINGNVSKRVQKLYFLGNLPDKVQIKVLSVDVKGGCKEYPDTSAWSDFYLSNTKEDNIRLMYEKLSSLLSVQFDQHEIDYHLRGFDKKELSSFILKDPLDIDGISKQYFYNHTYCKELSGFDFIKSFKQVDGFWYRLWNSGYLEQGGVVLNDSSELIEVEFLMQYDFPLGSNFYQQGYTKFHDMSIKGDISQNNRYCITVTPVKKEYSTMPYPITATDYSGVKLYHSVDITKISNSGFCIVNTDIVQDYYDKYYFYACGYTTKTTKEKEEEEKKRIYKVKFIDTHG